MTPADVMLATAVERCDQISDLLTKLARDCGRADSPVTADEVLAVRAALQPLYLRLLDELEDRADAAK